MPQTALYQTCHDVAYEVERNYHILEPCHKAQTPLSLVVIDFHILVELCKFAGGTIHALCFCQLMQSADTEPTGIYKVVVCF